MAEYPPHTPHRAHEYTWDTIPEGSPYRALEGTDVAVYICPMAGTQYHSRGRYDDDLDQIIDPQAGDILDLVREPDNPHDPNAIAVRWKNAQHMIGHVPRELAEDLAPAMDRGELLRAYCCVTGDYRPWTMCLTISGPIIEDWMARKEACDIEAAEEDACWHAEWAVRDEQRRKRNLEQFVEQAIETGEGVPAWEPDNPDMNQAWDAREWDDRLREWQDARRLDAVRAFRSTGRGRHKIEADDQPLPEPRPRRLRRRQKPVRRRSVIPIDHDLEIPF